MNSEKNPLEEGGAGVSPKLMRRFQQIFAAVVAVFVVSQAVPTMRAALAETCSLGAGQDTLTWLGSTGIDTGTTILKTTGGTLTINGKLNGSNLTPAKGNYTIIVSGSAANIADVTQTPSATLASIKLVRLSTASHPSHGTLVITITCTDLTSNNPGEVTSLAYSAAV